MVGLLLNFGPYPFLELNEVILQDVCSYKV